MRYDTIVGYTLNGETLCTRCMRTTAATILAAPGKAAFQGRPSDGDSTEQFLDRWAARDDVDRKDEQSFDSGDFPKVILAVQVEDTEACDNCGSDLIEGGD